MTCSHSLLFFFPLMKPLRTTPGSGGLSTRFERAFEWLTSSLPSAVVRKKHKYGSRYHV